MLHLSELLARRDDECPRGSQRYRCRSNHFTGCCSVDPCELPGCPDDRDDADADENGDGKNSRDESSSAERPSSTQTGSRTTIASLAPPVQPTATTSPSDLTLTTTVTELESSSLITIPESTPSGEDVSPTQVDGAPDASSTDPAGIPGATEAPKEGESGGGLSAGAKGGIIGAIGAIILLVIVIFFLCGKRGRRLRRSLGSGSFGPDNDPFSGKEGLQPYGMLPPPALTSPTDRQESLTPYEGRYEEPQSRYTRASAFTNTMKNHPVNPQSRDKGQNRNNLPSMTNMNLDPPESLASRPGTISPDFSRNETATPELQGSPKHAAVAELASPGLPRIVEISDSRQSGQRYKAYRPPESQLPPTSESSAVNLRGNLNSTAEERSRNKYVNSWSRWDLGGH